jgi:predicted transcriptional regulator
MRQLVKFERSCCVYGYLTERKEKSTREIARHLGVTPRTIRSYRKQMKDGNCQCTFAMELRPGENLLLIVPRRDLDTVAWDQCLVRSEMNSAVGFVSKPEGLSS